MAEKEEERKSCPHPVKCCGNKLFLLEIDDATGFQCVSSFEDLLTNKVVLHYYMSLKNIHHHLVFGQQNKDSIHLITIACNLYCYCNHRNDHNEENIHSNGRRKNSINEKCIFCLLL